jgi:hypothetical protein
MNVEEEATDITKLTDLAKLLANSEAQECPLPLITELKPPAKPTDTRITINTPMHTCVLHLRDQSARKPTSEPLATAIAAFTDQCSNTAKPALQFLLLHLQTEGVRWNRDKAITNRALMRSTHIILMIIAIQQVSETTGTPHMTSWPPFAPHSQT